MIKFGMSCNLQIRQAECVDKYYKSIVKVGKSAMNKLHHYTMYIHVHPNPTSAGTRIEAASVIASGVVTAGSTSATSPWLIKYSGTSQIAARVI